MENQLKKAMKNHPEHLVNQVLTAFDDSIKDWVFPKSIIGEEIRMRYDSLGFDAIGVRVRRSEME